MQRRSFLKRLGQGVIVSYGLFNFPFAGFAKSGFDYALEGQDLIQRKRFFDAVAALKESVRIDPTSDWAYGLLGRAYYGLGKKAEAVEAFRKAVRLNPDDTFSRMMIDIISQKPIPKLRKKKKTAFHS